MSTAARAASAPPVGQFRVVFGDRGRFLPATVTTEELEVRQPPAAQVARPDRAAIHRFSVEKSPVTGALLENLVLTGLLAWRESVHPRPELFYWRTLGCAEVDFVVERGARLLPIEIKKARQVGLSDIRHLELFLSDYKDKAPRAALLHDTDEPHLITGKVAGLPASHFF